MFKIGRSIVALKSSISASALPAPAPAPANKVTAPKPAVTRSVKAAVQEAAAALLLALIIYAFRLINMAGAIGSAVSCCTCKHANIPHMCAALLCGRLAYLHVQQQSKLAQRPGHVSRQCSTAICLCCKSRHVTGCHVAKITTEKGLCGIFCDMS